MAEADSNAERPRMAVAIAIALLILSTLVFAVAFVVASASRPTSFTPNGAQAYGTEIAVALESASAAEGESLIETFQCSVCHILGDERVAPRFAGIAERAGARRAPLPARQYLYESIVHPGAYLVEGYANAMPANYPERLSLKEIGNIIAYLLTQ